MAVIVLLICIFLSTFLCTAGMRWYAIEHHVLDIPNARSSHDHPIPHGRGAGIVINCLASYIVLGVFHTIPSSLVSGFVGAGLLVAGIGFCDDHGHVPPHWRIIVHFLAAIWAWFFIGDFSINSHLAISDWLLSVFLIVSVVWVLNLYNFMDGIDAIAGTEAVFVGLSAAIFFGLNGSSALAMLSVFFVAATMGFLVWNLPPARIFMGDVGSGFLGVIIGLLALAGIMSGTVNIWVWIILLGTFLVDATVTVVRRIINGAKYCEAHRSHAYQHLAIRWKSHRNVTLAVLATNLFWLFPLAYIAWRWSQLGGIIAVFALAPLVWIVFKLGAGKESTGITLQTSMNSRGRRGLTASSE